MAAVTKLGLAHGNAQEGVDERRQQAIHYEGGKANSSEPLQDLCFHLFLRVTCTE